jgi:hypothetical protein
MTITPATLYWITRLDGINSALLTSLLVSIVVFLFCGWALLNIWAEPLLSEQDEKDIKVIKKYTKTSGILGLFFTILTVLTPTSKEMAMIYVVPHLAESQVVKQDIPEVYDLGVKALKDWLKKETKGEQQ